MLKIAITGPESTGKSTLAEQLASHYQTVFVPEYAREYIAKLDRTYTQADILVIAKGQVHLEKILEKQANQILFADTELLVCKIWSENAFGVCDEWILEHLEKQDYDLYLLMDIDLAWIPDPQREHPHLRDYFFNLYKQSLMKMQANFVTISGTEAQRLQNAIEAIKFYIKKNNQSKYVYKNI